jgi:dihydrofolate reductase
MGKVVVELTMSLDGFIAGANITPEQPMGEGGTRLHDWFFGAKTLVDETIMQNQIDSTGAVIVGGRTYKDAIDDAWGGENPFHAPAFVLTHAMPKTVVDGFTFVMDGIESALSQAKAAAGDKNVWLMGGADVIQQYIKAGLVDEIHIHIAPVLFGAGTRLFDALGSQHIELENIQVIKTPAAVHLHYRVLN